MLRPPIGELLLSLGATLTNSGEYELPLDVWSRQRETIASIQKGVGARRRPSLWVTFSCPQCSAPGRDRAYEVRKKQNKGMAGPFCGQSCSTIAANAARGLSPKTCRNCGGPMNGVPRTQQTCSVTCRKASRQRAAVRRMKPIPAHPCEICAKPFVPHNRMTSGRFCSRACKDAGHSADMTGAANPGWRNGATDYRNAPHTARDFLRAKTAVLFRDHFRCVICNTDQDIQVHHINMEPRDNRSQNLVAICRTHHRRLHAAEKSLSRTILWPWLSDYANQPTCSTYKWKGPSAFSQTESSYTTA